VAVLSILVLSALQAGVAGRWDLMATEGGGAYPMWLEILAGPPAGGRLQHRSGHALPLTGVSIEGTRVRFPMPSEQPVASPAQFSATVTGDSLSGEIAQPDGKRIRIAGVRAPALERSGTPEWGAPIDLLARGIAAWRPDNPQGKNFWTIANGELVNGGSGVNLITRDLFTDFKLQVEVNVPRGGNSGIYLRGRHEVQVEDSYGKDPWHRGMGGIYGQLTPRSNPARQAGEWQSFDITLVGRRVTVVLNGVMIHDNAEIPGITGGALDSREGEPGPIMLQGDHGPIRYRNLRITPAK
jgi:hypothetical protein